MKISILGHGFVGKATDAGFKKNIEKQIIDLKYSNSIKDIKDFKPKFVFICLPTPMDKDGMIDDRSLLESVNFLTEETESIIIIKSTVLPSTIKRIENKKRIVYNPEFLREKFAEHDFINPDMIVLGGSNSLCLEVERLYAEHSNCKKLNFVQTSLINASLIKYTINCFLATKVSFMNMVHEYFTKENGDDASKWDKFANQLKLDKRIGKSHLQVPGPDGKKGFGGACFPKDTYAFLRFLEGENVNSELLASVINYNNDLRSKYKLDKREKEQKINFKL